MLSMSNPCIFDTTPTGMSPISSDSFPSHTGSVPKFKKQWKSRNSRQHKASLKDTMFSLYKNSTNERDFITKAFHENRRLPFNKLCVSILHTISSAGYSKDIRTFELLQTKIRPEQLAKLIDQPTGHHQYTPLCRAAYNGNGNMVLILMQWGANPNYVNSHGENLCLFIMGQLALLYF